MGKNLYVGRLSYNSTEAAIRELFEKIGPVDKVSVITDRETGNSKGFAFVEMGTEEDAMMAIEKYNNFEFEGRTLVVNEAMPKEDRKPFGGGGQNRGGYNGGGGYNNNRGNDRGPRRDQQPQTSDSRVEEGGMADTASDEDMAA